MHDRQETVHMDEARQAVQDMSRRVGLLHLCYARAIVDLLGKELGEDVIRKAIWEYGTIIGQRTRERVQSKGLEPTLENMRHGMSAEEAVLDAIKRVARNYNNDRARLEQFDLFFYALRKDGDHAAATLWDRSQRSTQRRQYVVNDGSGSRHVDASFLLKRS